MQYLIRLTLSNLDPVGQPQGFYFSLLKKSLFSLEKVTKDFAMRDYGVTEQTDLYDFSLSGLANCFFLKEIVAFIGIQKQY